MTPSKRDFALTYFGSVLGECGAWMNGDAVFYHKSCDPISNPICLSKLAATVGSESVFINEALPSDIYYQLVGYCVTHNMPMED